MTDKVQAIDATAKAFGARLQPAVNLLHSALSKAANVESTPVSSRTTDLAAALSSHLGLVDDIQEALADLDVLHDHIIAIAEATAAFGWVVSDDPVAHVEAAKAEVDPLSSILRSKPDPSHAQLADAIDDFVSTLADYVSKHPKALEFVDSVEAARTPAPTTPCENADSTHSAPHLKDFRKSVTDATVPEFVSASAALGGVLSTLANNFSSAIRDLYNFIVVASTMQKKPSDDQRQQMLAPIIADITAIGDSVRVILPSSPLYSHAKAVEDSLTMLSWIVAEEKPVSFVSEAEAAAAFYLNKVLVVSKGSPDAGIHRRFTDALKAVFSSMRAYIKEYHPSGLRYGLGVEDLSVSRSNVSPRPMASTDAADDDGENNYVAAFKALLEGPLTDYVQASEAIGGTLAQQATAFVGAWNAEADLITMAFKTPKPDDMQHLLTPIGVKMGEVSTIAESADPRGDQTQHLMAVSESVNALGWVAVDEKATSFVGDSASTGQFYIDKVKISAKLTGTPDIHRNWAKCLETLWSELKAYVKEYHTQSLVWNPPKMKSTVQSQGAIPHYEDDGSDYVSAFNCLISGPLAAYMQASSAVGDDVATQAKLFAEVWRAEAELIAKAISTPKPQDLQSMLAPIGAKMGEVVAMAERTDPRGPLIQHLMAVSESINAMGWVAVDERAAVYVGDSASTGQFYIDKVKMGAKKTDNPDAHREWAKSLESLWSELKAYVKEYHTQALVWNPPKQKGMAPRTTGWGDNDHDKDSSDYVTAFNKVVEGPVAIYVKRSQNIGGDVSKQATLFLEAWNLEAELLSKAIKSPKPDDVQSLLTPIGQKMGEVVAISENTDPRGPLANHLLAVSESVGSLGWVAVDEKAAMFVTDSAGTGQFYIDKVKMATRSTDKAADHRAWAQALEDVWNSLKVYVKEYHTQALVWNPPKWSKPASNAARTVFQKVSELDYLTAFEELLQGPLPAYVSASIKLGGEISKQATVFVEAWKMEYEFLKKAIGMEKPDDIQDLVMPIGTKMSEVMAFAENADPRGPESQHLTAVSESVGALGWVAVDEKATAFVGDSAGTGQFYIDKVKMSARNTDMPDAHREWAKCLETLWAALKAYVKEYHTQALTWKD